MKRSVGHGAADVMAGRSDHLEAALRHTVGENGGQAGRQVIVEIVDQAEVQRLQMR